MTPQTLAGADMGVGILGSAISGYGQYEAGQQQKKAYDYNAKVQAEAIAQKTSGRIGAQAATYAASGVDIASGSPLLVMAATAARGSKEEFETTTALKYEGAMAAWGGTMAGIGTFLSGLTKSAIGYQQATAKTPKPTFSPDPVQADLAAEGFGGVY